MAQAYFPDLFPISSTPTWPTGGNVAPFKGRNLFRDPKDHQNCLIPVNQPGMSTRRRECYLALAYFPNVLHRFRRRKGHLRKKLTFPRVDFNPNFFFYFPLQSCAHSHPHVVQTSLQHTQKGELGVELVLYFTVKLHYLHPLPSLRI